MSDIDTPTAPPALDIEAVIGKYVELRDLKAQMKAEFDEKVAPVQTALDTVERVLLAHMQANGSTGVKTKAGTAYVKETTSVTVADWDSFFEFVRSNNAWVMLNKAANKTAVQEYAADRGDLPPGLNFRVEQTVGIRRA